MPHYALSVVFVALVILAPLVVAWLAVRRSSYTLAQAVLFFVALLLTRILWRAQLPERLPLPSGRGAVVVCNHRSSVDPFFIQVCSARPIHWMVAQEYCEHPGFRWFLQACEVIPVSRGGIDTAATKAAIRLAAEGGVVGMLPEGRINMSGEFMMPVRPGAVLVALKARVPIVPVYIAGSPFDGRAWGPLLMSARVRVRVGQPIELEEYLGCEDEEGVVESLILKAVKQIAVLAGQPDYEPQLAGRRWRPSDEEQRALVERVRQRARSGPEPRGPRAEEV